MNLIKSAIVALTIVMATACNTKKNNQVSEKALETVKTKKENKMKVLFVLTSHDKLGETGKKTGFWVEEFANPYYTLLDKGAEITIATPKGGAAPIDPSSDSPDAATEDTERFNKDAEAKDKIANTKVLADINADDFDAVFYPGGHGPLWDLANDEKSIALIEKFNEQKKPVAFVCHAPAALKGVKGTDGNPLVKGKKVTGFTNSEEEAVQLTNVVPFLVEDMLKENGGIYSKKEDWAAYAIQDGNLITGQNPASSELVADKLVAELNK
ncbi:MULTISPECIES: type 1 glutamine amidotransferase domain-containing protein [unclassified Cellulophaga]|uniref:type 1 glutamine amidotransferase domain-containing protein n=1 Tax=unclassified Cellulophaga TaxID=2634405 RepID=UPI0026E18DAD|nr:MULTISPECIES: type 1 glutamine amidotransferase domain-containing protein [unclassified Cellulophaga]MDO6492472.1 type 1 glutamine amidotransferase domain-containing protein [Cellulophaga sp. 2_MG-2023]MDO6493574.1 type 1 glutamine amidotransferase domain-containing protein [Cellulophaga sp. 3_MG-2023]